MKYHRPLNAITIGKFGRLFPFRWLPFSSSSLSLLHNCHLINGLFHLCSSNHLFHFSSCFDLLVIDPMVNMANSRLWFVFCILPTTIAFVLSSMCWQHSHTQTHTTLVVLYSMMFKLSPYFSFYSLFYFTRYMAHTWTIGSVLWTKLIRDQKGKRVNVSFTLDLSSRRYRPLYYYPWISSVHYDCNNHLLSSLARFRFCQQPGRKRWF